MTQDYTKLLFPAYTGPRIARYFGGPWSMHLPFAYDLMREFRPRAFVELGVYKGESYFAFCQSAAENGVNVLCYGVDTWKGDPQTGFYGPDVGQDVATYNTQYATFSQLISATFEDAVNEFTDGAIDLLHIDGAHRYSDVKGDFESWRRKLSPRAIVLFHDVMVRDREFGVSRLWMEMAEAGRSFLFPFGHGLGVWSASAVGKGDSKFVRHLFEANPEEQALIIERYAAAGVALGLWAEGEQLRRMETRLQETEGKQKELIAKLRSESDHKTELLQHAAQTNQAKQALILHLERQAQEGLKELTMVRAKSQEELEGAANQLSRTNELLHSKTTTLAAAEARIGELVSNFNRQLSATKKLTRLLDDVVNATKRLRRSRRWRIGNPFAALRAAIRRKPELMGYGHLEKVISAYSQLRSTHAEVREVDRAIAALKSAPPVSDKVSVAKITSCRFEPSLPAKPIAFPVFETVDISIIIPIFNHLRFTQACLASIQEHHDDQQFEVIIVDDCSTDASPEVLARLPGVRYLRNKTNLGFGGSCNKAVREARGSYLVFLNNDTTVRPGWLSELRATFRFEPEAGLVGSKLVYPDGRLQEAGGIIWRDGSGWNRGKFDDPDKPEYNFLSEVDYCSAACLMIRKSLFEKLSGFDPKYSPAYYEDTDLAFKIRQAGYSVLYQPLSSVFHYEGVTGGTDISAGVKKHQEINRSTFLTAWSEVLATKPLAGDVKSLRTLEHGRKRILVIDHHLPMPDRDSGSLRMSQILRILHRLGHRLTFIPDNLGDIPPYGDVLRRGGVEVVCQPYITNVAEYLQTAGRDFDVVILSRCDVAIKHIEAVRQFAPQSRVIFDTVDLHFLRTDREAGLTNNIHGRVLAREKQKQEYKLINDSDETWVVSPFEQQLLQEDHRGKSIQVISNIVDVCRSEAPFERRRDFLFIGSFQHTPNVDAVLYFTTEIFPLVLKELPDAKLYIIGDKPPTDITALASKSVIVTGFRPDVRPYFDEVKLSIAPLRYGAGVKGKINQSMAFGVPVVATSAAVEGMGLEDRRDVLVADAPTEFAAAVCELYENEELWQKISKNGIEKTKVLYSFTAVQAQLRLIVGGNGKSDARCASGA